LSIAGNISEVKMIQKKKQAVSEKVPPGCVSCMLCGGFISVSGGDRARFVDHMTNEHDAKTDCHQALLALCVLNDKERAFLAKSTSRRLDTIGRNKPANYSDSFLSRFSDNVPPAPAVPARQQRPPPAPQQKRTRVVQPVRSVQTVPSVQGVQSGLLRGNRSISVSKVDMRRQCNMCHITVQNPQALIEHMNRNHFNSPGGINIITNSITKSITNSIVPRRAEPQVRSRQVLPVKNHLNSKVGKVEVVKCPSCGKSVDKSKFAIHSLSHSQQRKPSKPNVLKNKGITLQNLSTYPPSTGKNENIELVELCDDTEEVDHGSLEMDTGEGDNDNQPETENLTAVRNEIEKLDTLELLDNLVNFLQT